MKKENVNKKNQKKNTVKKAAPVQKAADQNNYFNLIGLIIIILLGIIIYSNSFTCSFHFDDLWTIVNNPKIRDLRDVRSWWSIYPTRPVAIFSFAVNYNFNKLDVYYWHYVNLVIHLINALLVWWLTMLIFSSPVMKDKAISKYGKLLSFATALLFVSHPLATQSVTYIVQRMASMTAMFYLFSIVLYIKARLSGKGNILKYVLFAFSFVSMVLAMLTKENAFTLPFAILLVEVFFIRKKKININFKDYRIILSIAALIGLASFLIWKYASNVFAPIAPAGGNDYTVTSQNYLLTQFSVIVKYIQLLLFPVHQNLDYNFPISNSFFELRTLLSFLVIIALITLAIFLFNRNRIISFGIFWFFLTLSIESGFIPINDVIFEHRTYLPSFGFFLILSSAIYFLLWNKNKYLAISLLVIIICVNSIMTFARNKVWKDEITLWSDVISKSPDKARPWVNRGLEYWRLNQKEKAIADYTKAIEINPQYYHVSYYNRGLVYENLQQWDKAIADYSKTIEINPNYVNAYSNRGAVYADIRQWDKAIADYTKAIKIDSLYSEAYYNRGLAYRNLEQWDKAIADYNKAIEISPNFANYYNNRAIIYYKLGEWEKAIADYTNAIRVDPKYTLAYNNRGLAYGHLRQFEKAKADFSKAIEIDPNYKDARSNLEIVNNMLPANKK
jgi:protein O-mannosyl-transferase